MKDKKAAMEMEEFGKYILIIASFIILIVFVVKFFGGLQGAGVEQACRTSVTLRTTLHWDKKITNVYPLQCQTQEFIIPEQKMPRNLDEATLKRAVYGEISDMMAKCWWMFGNGYYHNLLDDKFRDDQLCHVCYSFTINPRYTSVKDENGNPKPVEYNLAELGLYLANVPYSPGLLQGGGAALGDAADHTFTPQETLESSRESRQLNEGRLLNSRKRMETHVADFSGIYAGKEQELDGLRDKLHLFARDTSLEPALVIVPSLPEEELAEGSKLPIKLMQEWQIGNSIYQNGIVFIISLNDGKVLYATGFGAAGILYRSDIENVLSEGFDANMAAKDPVAAIDSLVDDLRATLEKQDFVVQKLKFQQSYMGYITGGTRVFDIGSSDAYYGNDELKTQGSLAYEPGLTTFNPGEYYAITYINSYWRSQTNIHVVTQYAAIAGVAVGAVASGVVAAIAIAASGGLATPLVIAAYSVAGGVVGGAAWGTTAQVGTNTGIIGKTNDASIPNMIGLTSYKGLLENAICNTNLDEG